MPSSIDRSAPAENASLPEVTTTPLTAASAEVCFTISSSSRIVVSSSTFIERPGMSQVASAMPSASVSTLKFLKAMCCSRFNRCVRCVGWAKARSSRRAHHHKRLTKMVGTARSAPLPTLRPSNSLDDRRGAHAAADAQRHQGCGLVGALELVEHGAENHRARRAERMAERDGAAIDVDLRIVDVEGLDVAQHDRRKGFVQLEQVDVGFLHARALEQFFGDV